MKTLLVLARIIFIGALWSIIFIEGVRVIMLENWRFDIFYRLHWLHAWNLWLSGWVIDTAKEWAFVLILVAFIPLWLTGWIALSLLPWEVWLYKLVTLPFHLVRRIFNPLQIMPAKAPVVIKRKSYKEIRPTGPRTPIYDYNDTQTVTQTPTPSASVPVRTTPQPAQENTAKTTDTKPAFNHAVFDFDDEDDFDLDFDTFEQSDIFKAGKKTTAQRSRDEIEETETETSSRHSDNRTRRNDNSTRRDRESVSDRRDDRSNREDRSRDRRNTNTTERPRQDARSIRTDKPQARPNNPVADVLIQKGYDLISEISVQKNIIDFIGISDDKICVCLIDKESGDWLADEERFNNEEPLWFSESSHRVSPVRKAGIIRQILSDKLLDEDFDQTLEVYVIEQSGNIINAEDMFDIWNDLNIFVTRINRGSPKEIPLFSKTVTETDNRMDKSRLNDLKKLLKSMN